MSYANYKTSSIATADRGKLVIMIYDHCIKWTMRADEAMTAGHIETMVKAVQRVQSGLTELMCALDMDKGGDIAQNLFRLYNFYSGHLTNAIKDRSAQFLKDVLAMLSVLRGAWIIAIENVRKEDHASLSGKPAQFSLVS